MKNTGVFTVKCQCKFGLVFLFTKDYTNIGFTMIAYLFSNVPYIVMEDFGHIPQP